MGGGSSLNVTSDEVDDLSPEELANLAKKRGAHDVVVSTIVKENIHGRLAKELSEGDLEGMATGLNYKRLTSALHTLEEAEELENEARELFAKYDVNNDHLLDQNELGILMCNEIGVPPKELGDIYKEFDHDQDGSISFEEFVKNFNLIIERQSEYGTRGGGGGGVKIGYRETSQHLRTGRTLASLFPKGKRIAAIFACDDYSGSEHDGKPLPNLRFAVKDAELFRDTVKQAGFEIFSYKINAECSLDSMRDVIDDVINHFNEMSSIAQFIFYFAGHGIKDKNSKGWLALHKYNSRDRGTKFKMSDLTHKASEIGAIQQLYVLDCCHAGELFHQSRGAAEFGMELATKPCIYGITAVTGDQEAEEEDGHGLFTKTLCYGIGEKQAAMQGKPYATSNDLLEFVQVRVHDMSNNRMQPLGEKMLHDHFEQPCNGQFIMFHEETINKLNDAHEEENRLSVDSGGHNTRGALTPAVLSNVTSLDAWVGQKGETFPIGQPKNIVETFQFTREGDIYVATGTDSGRNTYTRCGEMLVHQQHSFITATLQPNGELAWSTRHNSRICVRSVGGGEKPNGLGDNSLRPAEDTAKPNFHSDGGASNVPAFSTPIQTLKLKYQASEHPPIIQAAMDGVMEDVKLLLGDLSLNLNGEGVYGRTALQVASAKGHTNIVNLLLRQKDVNVNHQDSGGVTALMSASFYGHVDTVKALLEQSDLDPNIPFYQAEGVRDPMSQGWYGATALHGACSKGHSGVVQVLVQDNRTNVNATANMGYTPLHTAAWYGNAQCVENVLANRHVAVNIVDKFGHTPLWCASCIFHENVAIQTMLRDKGATKSFF